MTGSVAADAAMDPLFMVVVAAVLWFAVGFVFGRATR